VSEVKVSENESLDSALKRFKKDCARSGIMLELRRKAHYEKPSIKRKRKLISAKRRKLKKLSS
jgi:small subunit ribosomal protein S21